jgi:hypothetical protein
LLAVVGTAASDLRAAEAFDVSYIGRDAVAAVVLHPRAVLTSPEAEMFPIEILQAACLDNFGFDPLDVEEAVGILSMTGLPMGQPGLGVVLRFGRPFDREKVRGKLEPNTQPATHAGKEYREPAAPNGFAFFIADDRTLIIASKLQIRPMLAADKVDSPLVKLLGKVDTSKDALVVADIASLRPLILLGLQNVPPLPDEYKDFLELPRIVDWISVSLGVRGGFAVGATFGAANEKNAARIHELAERAKKLARDFLSDRLPDLMESDKDATSQATAKYVQRLGNKLLDGLDFKLEKDQVRVELSLNAPSLAVGGIATALVLPAVQAAREAARRNNATNKLKQIGLGMHNYLNSNRSFPPRAIVDKSGKPLLSWRVALLPYLGQDELYKEFHLDEPWNSEHNSKLVGRMPQEFASPQLDAAAGTTLYQVPVGEGTLFEGLEGKKLREIVDGTSRTIMAVETNPDKMVVWTQPADLAYDPKQPLEGLGKVRPGGFLALFADGSVHFISADISPDTLRAMVTYAGREPLPPSSNP